MAKFKKLPKEHSEAEEIKTPAKKTLNVIRQKMHRFDDTKSIEEIDKAINDFLEEKFKAGQNPMIFKQIVDKDNYTIIITLHTEKIDID